MVGLQVGGADATANELSQAEPALLKIAAGFLNKALLQRRMDRRFIAFDQLTSSQFVGFFASFFGGLAPK
jgi:hypothetical protein